MEKELLMLLKEFKAPIIDFLNNVTKTQLLDYLPYVISISTIISSVIIVSIQHRQSVKLHQEAERYNTKKETILEALSFLDTFISWLDMESGSHPLREEISEVALTVKARTIHNKLCIVCGESKIVELFVDIVCPNKNADKDETVFEKYYKFRNECRIELGQKAMSLSMDRIYLSQISTRALRQKQAIQSNMNIEKNSRI